MSPQRSSCRSSRIFPPGSTSILPSRSRFRRRRSWLNRSQRAHRRSSVASGSPATRLRSRARLATPSSAARPSIGRAHLLARSIGCERGASTPSSSRCSGVARIGEETQAARFDFGAAQYLGVAWRFRNILSGCVGGGSAPKAEILVVARAQQRRIAQTGLPAGRPPPGAARSWPGLRPRMEVEWPAVPARLRPVVGVLLRIAD